MMSFILAHVLSSMCLHFVSCLKAKIILVCFGMFLKRARIIIVVHYLLIRVRENMVVFIPNIWEISM